MIPLFVSLIHGPEGLYAITLTEYGGLYCGAITHLESGRRVELRDGQGQGCGTFVTGDWERAQAWRERVVAAV